MNILTCSIYIRLFICREGVCSPRIEKRFQQRSSIPHIHYSASKFVSEIRSCRDPKVCWNLLPTNLNMATLSCHDHQLLHGSWLQLQ